MTRIVVLDGHTVNPGDNPWDELAQLGELVIYERTAREHVAERARGADILLTNKTWLDAEALAGIEGLKGICVLATGYNVVDVRAARERGIPVCNVPSYSSESVVEHTFALLFELTRAVGLHDRAVHAGDWENSPDFCFWRTPQLELSAKTMGVVGYGSIGRRVAEVARAFGMRVVVTRSSRHPAGVDALETLPLEAIFATADVVSLHCPLTPETEELIRWDRLVTMKRTALLVNTARGALVREDDLARALHEGVIAGAALDVLCSEPPEPGNPLLRAPRCLITPHLAWTSLEARRRLVRTSVDNVRAILAGQPIHVVNLQK
jgi:glycerate dehydrogenase